MMVKYVTIHSGVDSSAVVQVEDSVRTDSARRYHLLQFTGLKDKNGRDIYGGDIVKHVYDPVGDREMRYEKTDTEEIAYANDCFGFKRGEDVIRLGECMFFKEGKAGDLEVVGNVYENPELLDVTKEAC